MKSKKIPKPNFTQIPNIVIDEWMDLLDPYEFKVLIFICRKTFGWHKEKDKISLNQIIKHTNICKQKVLKSIETLIRHDLIIKIKSLTELGDYDSNCYEINFLESEGNEVVCDTNHPSAPHKPPLVCDTNHPPQEPIHYRKERDTKETTAKPACAEAAVSLPLSLEQAQIPQSDKAWIAERYSAEIIDNAISYATAPTTQIKTTLAATIKWACKEKPEITPDPQSFYEINQLHASQIERCCVQLFDRWRMEASPSTCIIYPIGGQCESIDIAYDQNPKLFASKLEQFMRAKGIWKADKVDNSQGGSSGAKSNILGC